MDDENAKRTFPKDTMVICGIVYVFMVRHVYGRDKDVMAILAVNVLSIMNGVEAMTIHR